MTPDALDDVSTRRLIAAERIAWYSSLKQGLAGAKTTGRPILLISAAPHCHGISGIW